MYRQSFSARVSGLLIALLVLINQGVAQSDSPGDASLKISVVDANRAAVVAARVWLNSQGRAGGPSATDHRGEVKFDRLKAGQYQVRVEAEGFEARTLTDLDLRPGPNDVTVSLDVAQVNEEMVVTQDEREKKTDPRGNAFTSILTESQISELPDDPEEFETALRQLAGPGSSIRVNGFAGGKLPPKSQIREIRFRLNPFAAENHEGGLMGVDIFTKPGMDRWHGGINFGFRGEALSARNPFAARDGSEQYKRFGLALGGPLWRNRTSLFLSAEGTHTSDPKTIVAALPEGRFSDLFASPSQKLNFSTRIEHVLTQTHTLRGEYQRNIYSQEKLGVGNFDLPERAYSMRQSENLLRLSDTGMLTERFINEFRFQARWQQIGLQSASSAPALLVLNAFNRGGAQIQGGRRAFDLELADNVDFAFKQHSMKAGVLLQAGFYRSDERQNATGTFTFASVGDFLAQRPTTFTQRVGDSAVAYNQYQVAWFWRDDIRLRKDLSISLGLRHEMQTNLQDRNNLAPRASLAWSPFADGKTTFRIGAGIFYDWFGAEALEQTLRVDGRRQRDIVVLNPGFPDPFDTGLGVSLPPGRVQAAPDMVMPYAEQASFGVERQLPGRFQLRATYYYERGVHLLRGRNVNAPAGTLGRPDLSAGNIIEIESTANSFSHAVNINLSRFSKRLFLLVNYSLATAINEADGPLSLPANNFDLRSERGYALSDSRHRLYTIVNFNLYNQLRLASIFSLDSPTPYNITTGFDDNGDSISNDRPDGVMRNSARGDYHWDVSTRLSWTLGFGKRNGQPGRNINVAQTGSGAETLGGFSAPGLTDKKARIQLYFQVYNLFNHANLINFTGVRTSPFFGQATAALPGRRIEAGVRFDF